MPRPPLFDRAMTVAERVRRHRARKRQHQANFSPTPTAADLERWRVVEPREDDTTNDECRESD